MKKILSAVALAVLATGAFAQSSVTIYGRLNVTAEYQELANGDKIKVLQNNASRIGFKGVEDLGGGLKAGFQLEHGFNADTGVQSGSAFFNRQSEVNLGGGFGLIRLGNFTSEAYYATSDYIGLHNHETGTSSDALYAYLTRNINKIAYRTPELIKGLTLEAAAMAGEGGGRPRQYDAALNYQLGSLHLGVGYEKSGEAWQTAVSALYEFGPFIVGAMLQRDEDGYGANLGKRTNGRVSMAYNFGANELHLNVGKAGDYSRVRDSDATQWTVAYNYNLSKRTKVYAFYTELDASRFTPYASDFKSLAAGVRHNF